MESRFRETLRDIGDFFFKVFLILALVLIAGRCYFRIPVAAYYGASEEAFVIPDCDDGFVAQGLDYDEANDYFLVGGYMKDGSASRIHLVNRAFAGRDKTLLLADEAGEAFCGHAGGLAVYGDFVYVTDGNGLIVYSLADFLEAEDKASVAAIGTVPLELSEEDYIRASFLSVVNDMLYVGEFYRDKDPNLDSHKTELEAGGCDPAIAVSFALDAELPLGIDATPCGACSLPALAQGMCYDDETGVLFVSTSYGVRFSHIYSYSTANARISEITVLGTTVPLFVLGDGAMLNDRKIAPMSEEIVTLDGEMYVMSESASNKYIFGKFTSSEWCYKTDVNYLIGLEEAAAEETTVGEEA